MSKLADDRNALPQARAHDPQETEAVRETVAEWMEAQARRVASGAYLADLEDGTGGRNPVVDVCFLALQAAGMAYTVAEAYRDEDRMDAASELEEEVGAAVRAVLPPEMHDDVLSDAFDAVGDRVAGLEAEPSPNGGGKSDDPPAPADMLELPRELVERLAREANLLGCALTGLNQMEARSFVDLETARLLARKYDSRLSGALAELEAELGLASDAYVSGILATFKAHEAAKRRELAEELEGGD